MLQNLKTYFSHPHSFIVGFGFIILSLLLSTWVTRLPELKANLGINDTQLGIALLVFSVAALIISPFSSYIMDRFPNGKATYVSAIIQICTFILPYISPNYSLFLLAMFVTGLANGFMNITINASAAIVEKHYGRRIMSNSHGMFSSGAILGSIIAGLVANIGVDPAVHMAGLILVLLLINYSLRKVWFTMPDISLKAPVFAFPNLALLGIFLISICIVLAELTVMDWSAMYLKDTLKSSALISGMGFAGFSLSMAIGRLSSDLIIATFGGRQTIILGCMIAGVGMGIAGLTNHPFVAIMGFAVAGLGMSTIIPLIYSMSAKLKDTSPGLGIGSIATACVLAGLIGRPMVGWISDFSGMATSILMASGVAITAALIGLIAAPRKV